MYPWKIVLVFYLALCGSVRVTYLDVERPTLLYTNKNYIGYANVTSLKYTRKSMYHQFSLTFEAYYGFGNNVTIDVYFYEFLTNQYKPTFVEMHFGACEITKKEFFGPALRGSAFSALKCPCSKGIYHIPNMTVPTTAIPKSFPFSKGRIFVNSSLTNTKELLASGYADMELKQITIKTKG